jgi:2-hydroxychromene-2-carboxylate isomerase
MALAIDWYFDFVSPFSYLQLRRLLARPLDAELRCHPVLLAGLLNHWGQLGPAEISPKRTADHCGSRARVQVARSSPGPIGLVRDAMTAIRYAVGF